MKRPNGWTLGDDACLVISGRNVHGRIVGFTHTELDGRTLERVTLELPSGDRVSRRFSDLGRWPVAIAA